jgi:hypothetical protein
LIEKINEYYALSNNLKNLSFINKNYIQPIKNLSSYKSLPNKISDKNFSLLNDSKRYNNYLIYEFFINKSINCFNEMKDFYSNLKHFVDNIAYYYDRNKKFPKNESIEFLLKNKRRYTRVNLKKFFRGRNNHMVIFFDIILYYVDDPIEFKEITEGFCSHMEQFYINLDS